MKTALQKITDHAKKIRKQTGCTWRAAVKKAGVEYRKGAKGSSVGVVNGIRKKKRAVKKASRPVKKAVRGVYGSTRKHKFSDDAAKHLRDMTEAALFKAKIELAEVRKSKPDDKRWNKKKRSAELSRKIKIYKEGIRKLNSSLLS